MSGVKLPQQVEEINRRTEEAVKAFQGNTDSTAEGTPENPAPDTDSNPAPNDGDQPNKDMGTPGPDEKGRAPGEGDAEELRHRLSVLQGKYDAEVPALSREKRRLLEQNTALHARVNELETALQEAKAKAEKTETDGGQPRGSLTPEDYADYGDEFVTMARENNELKATVAEMQEQLNSIKGEVGTVAQATARDSQAKFLSGLTKALPEWDQINNDHEFIDFLEADGTLAVFQSHAHNFDVEKTVKFMRRFLAESGKSYGASDKKPKPSQPKAPSVEPSSGKSAPDIDPDETGRTYSSESVREFYALYSRGRFPFNWGNTIVHTRADAQKIDAEITLAGMQGRVTQG
jgi:hypothetical protein